VVIVYKFFISFWLTHFGVVVSKPMKKYIRGWFLLCGKINHKNVVALLVEFFQFVELIPIFMDLQIQEKDNDTKFLQ
jgi:hypothetical protein